MTRAELVTYMRDKTTSNSSIAGKIIPGYISDLNDPVKNKQYPVFLVLMGEARTGLRSEYTDYPLLTLMLDRHPLDDTREKFEVESAMEVILKAHLKSMFSDVDSTSDIIGVVGDTNTPGNNTFNIITQKDYLNDRLTGVQATFTIRVFSKC